MDSVIDNSAITATVKPDDLVTLSQSFSLPILSYVDIYSEQQLVQIMQRWPLLAELADKQITRST